MLKKIKKSQHYQGIYFELHQLKSDKPTLLFLHGFGGSLRVWDPIVNYFHKKGYSTLTIDLRGHGISFRPKKLKYYQLKYFAKDIEKIVSVLSIDQLIIIGHCFGGLVTMKLVKRKKIDLQAQVLIANDPFFHFPSNLLITFKYFFKLIAKMFLIIKKPLGLIKHIDYNRFQGEGDYNPNRVISDISHTSLQSYFATIANLTKQNDDILTNLHTLIIHGQQDKIFPVRSAKKLHQQLQNSKLVVLPKANHLIPISEPEKLCEVIEEYLEKNF